MDKVELEGTAAKVAKLECLVEVGRDGMRPGGRCISGVGGKG